MNDKTIKQAQKLIPGKDVLVKADGSTTPIISLEVRDVRKRGSTTSPLPTNRLPPWADT